MKMKYARIEYERRFLFRRLPEAIDPLSGYTQIFDRYIKGANLRLRRMTGPDGQVLERKFGKKFRLHEMPPEQTVMTNLYLDEAEYQQLTTLPARTLTKKRYPYESGGQRFSLDVFDGALAGLVLGEIEKEDPAILQAVSLPAGCLQEVTADDFFTGGSLVRLDKDAFQKQIQTYLA